MTKAIAFVFVFSLSQIAMPAFISVHSNAAEPAEINDRNLSDNLLIRVAGGEDSPGIDPEKLRIAYYGTSGPVCKTKFGKTCFKNGACCKGGARCKIIFKKLKEASGVVFGSLLVNFCS